MAVVARRRTLDLGVLLTGEANRPSWPTYSQPVVLAINKKVTDDVVGNYPNPNGFSSVHQRASLPVLNGEQVVSGSVVRQYVNCPVTYTPFAQPPPILSLPVAVTDEEMGRKAIVQTNPFAADISLPSFVGELRDFPGLLRHFGVTSIRAFRRRMKELRGTFSKPSQALRLQAETNLLWRFGIAPMVGDLQKLLNFQALVARRIDMFQRMEKNGGIKRRFSIGTVDKTELLSSARAFESRLGSVFYGREVRNCERRQWSTVRWDFKYDKWRLPKDDAAMARLARRCVLGMTAHGLLETMWELTPWSWLIDWFVNVGAFLKRHNNTVPIVPSRVCVMTNTRNTVYIVPTVVPSWCSLTGPYMVTWEEKKRKVVSSGLADLPECKMPFLTVGQMSILGSLAVTRMVTR